ncbi:MAG: ECF transporter S component [Oscillospiraceae bacterium]|nr:ECF transporter S component [Oscillospiraceae bacterium]
MAKTNNRKVAASRTHNLALLGILTAVVVVLQLLALATRAVFPVFAISLVLIPITVGAAVIGVRAGAWLGLAFGAAVLISGDAAWFFSINQGGTVATVLVKGALAGLAAGGVYKLFAEVIVKNRTVAAIAAGIICPIVNTGVFVIGSYLFFLPEITEWGATKGFESGASSIFFGMVGTNFLVELGINMVFIPVIVRLIQHGNEKRA